MSNKKTDIIFNRQTKLRSAVYIAIAFIGAALTYLTWVGAAVSLCGISGCSGGGFGPTYDPESVKRALIGSGFAAAAAPLLIYVVSKFKWWWLLIAVVSFIAAPILGAYIIRAGFDGYPVGM